MSATSESIGGARGAPSDPGAPHPMAAGDPTREKRVKALHCTHPLHDLHVNRGRRGQARFDFYDLGLAAIDLVVDRMGLSLFWKRSYATWSRR